MKIRLWLGMALLALSSGLAAAPKLTLYDDGRSCPADCDAHVVMHPSLNGTRYARQPGSADSPIPCERDAQCEICFDDQASECLLTPYRGAGPGENTFDLTPAFYESWCAKTAIPTALRQKCTELQQASRSLDGRVNCIRNPQHEQCYELMESAIQAKQRDLPIYEECRNLGQSAFNRGRPAAQKRAHGCAYEFESNGGPNSRGLRWKKLQPGACRADTYVGRDGLDCCSGNTFVDAALGIECRLYYPPEVHPN